MAWCAAAGLSGGGCDGVAVAPASAADHSCFPHPPHPSLHRIRHRWEVTSGWKTGSAVTDHSETSAQCDIIDNTN